MEYFVSSNYFLKFSWTARFVDNCYEVDYSFIHLLTCFSFGFKSLKNSKVYANLLNFMRSFPIICSLGRNIVQQKKRRFQTKREFSIGTVY